MGRRKAATTDDGVEIPRGIQVRDGKSLVIHFRYKGERCRETLPLLPTKKNIEYARDLRAEVLNRVARGSFN